MKRQYKDDILLKKAIGKLKALREAKGISLETVYNDIDVNIGRIESLKSNISLSTLARLCKYYKISLSEFFKSISQ